MVQSKRCGFAWLELLFALSLLTLAGLLFPAAFVAALHYADPRHWGRAAWIGLNCAAICGLLAIRFRRELNQARRSLFASGPALNAEAKERQQGESEQDFAARVQRDEEWRERAKKRLPFT